MITATEIEGVKLIMANTIEDVRGHSIDYAGINFSLYQNRITKNNVNGTIRGIHYQDGESAQGKYVRCSRGSIFDVVIDLRKDSHTYLNVMEIVLIEYSPKMLYIPKGCAHGFQTLRDNTEVTYLIDAPFDRGNYCGIRFDDPMFKIKWPEEVTAISTQDCEWPDFK